MDFIKEDECREINPIKSFLAASSFCVTLKDYVLMKQFFLAIVLIVLISGCSGGNAKELFETAKFEELQNNKAHATELYEEVIRKYPKSDYALKAQERLDAMSRP